MKKRALVVGIDSYERIKHLNGCVNDAKEVAERLAAPQFGFDVDLLTDDMVTRKTFRSAINTLLSNADFSLLYFAGHGIRTSVSTYLATVDAEMDDEGVPVGFLVEAISRLTQQNQTVVIILDCCHAGDASVPATEQLFTPMMTTDMPQLSGSGRLLIASCLGEQKAIEGKTNGVNHGVFTKHLLDGLSGDAADSNGNVTVLAVYEFVASALENGGRQKPLLRGDQNGRIVLGSGVKATGTICPDDQAIHLKSEIIREAEAHVADYFSAVQAVDLRDFEARGHREASQRLAPIIEWFQRRISENQKLSRDVSFKKSWSHVLQQYQHLSNITTGVILDKSREVGDFIGSGTFGSVWKIIDQGSSLTCFKSYHSTELRDLEKVSRFNRGYRAMTHLDHPNIVKVHECTVVPLGFYMQYIEGANLRQYGPATSCDIDQIVDILLDVGETLRHAHGRNVLHRDVKPENILLEVDEEGALHPFLTDFDLSWFSTATKLTTLAGDGFGSHFYAAPEQMNSPGSQAAHKPSVDAYSFGQVMFYSFCGRDPAILNERGNSKAFSEHLSNLAISEKIATLLTTLYQNCTVVNPDRRLADFRTICDRLSHALSILRTPDDNIPSHQFLRELRFLITGALSKSGDSVLAGSVTLSSPSGRTNIPVLVKRETTEVLSLEATFIPAQSPVINGTNNAAAARQVVNSRIDHALAAYSALNHTKRTAPKGGAYQCIVTFDNIAKNAEGLSRCRELLMAVVDCIEGY